MHDDADSSFSASTPSSTPGSGGRTEAETAAGTAADGAHRGTASVREPARARRRRRWVWGTAAVTAVLLGIGAATIPVDRVIEMPGPTFDVNGSVDMGDGPVELVSISGAPTYDPTSNLRMTTVSIQGCPGYPTTVLDLVGAWLDDTETVLDREDVCPSNVTADEYEEVSRRQMTSSQDMARVAALMETGDATGMQLTIEGGEKWTDGIVEAGDVIRSLTVGGTTTPITSYATLRAILAEVEPGSSVELEVERAGQPTTLTLTTHAPQDPEERGSILGIYLSATLDTDVTVDFELEDVGGPSAGMMFALGIVDRLTPGPIAGDHVVAGTGTISMDGRVGPIGGIAQKMVGARDTGAEYFLAPEANCDEVIGHVPEGLQVFSVGTLHDAVVAAEGIASGDTAALPVCH